MSDNNGDSNPSKSKKGPPEKPSASADPPPIASDQRKRDETETIDASQPVIDGKKRSLIGRVQIGSVIIVWDNGKPFKGTVIAEITWCTFRVEYEAENHDKCIEDTDLSTKLFEIEDDDFSQEDSEDGDNASYSKSVDSYDASSDDLEYDSDSSMDSCDDERKHKASNNEDLANEVEPRKAASARPSEKRKAAPALSSEERKAAAAGEIIELLDSDSDESKLSTRDAQDRAKKRRRKRESSCQNTPMSSQINSSIIPPMITIDDSDIDPIKSRLTSTSTAGSTIEAAGLQSECDLRECESTSEKNDRLVALKLQEQFLSNAGEEMEPSPKVESIEDSFVNYSQVDDDRNPSGSKPPEISTSNERDMTGWLHALEVQNEEITALEDNLINRADLLANNKCMIESIDEFVLEYPEEISAHILSMRFDSLAYLESRTPTDEFKFVDHETPTHVMEALRTCGGELLYRVEAINRARDLLKDISKNDPDQKKLCVAAMRMITQLEQDAVLVIVILLNGHGEGRESLGSGCRNVKNSKSPSVKAMKDVSKAFRAFSDLFYLEGDDEAGIKALGVNMDDVEEGWMGKRRKKGDNPIRANIINIILRCADAIGAKVVMIDWSGVTSGGKYMIEQLDLDKISVLVQGLYHITYCGRHQRYQGSGRDAKHRSVVANTTRIAALSVAVTDFCVKNNFDHQPSILGALSDQKFVDPSVLLLSHDSSILSPRRVEKEARQAAKTARQSLFEDNEVEVVENEPMSQSDGKIENALVAIITEAENNPNEPSSGPVQFPCLDLAGKSTNAETCSTMMSNLGLISLDGGTVAFVDDDDTDCFRNRHSKLREEAWNKQFDELTNYKAKHGDCDVPGAQGTLGRWVSHQREIRETMSRKRFDALDKIGFTWSVYESAWNKHFDELTNYKAKHGDCDVLRNQGPLGTWVRTQQKNRETMSRKRFDALDKIGFIWNAR